MQDGKCRRNFVMGEEKILFVLRWADRRFLGANSASSQSNPDEPTSMGYERKNEQWIFRSIRCFQQHGWYPGSKELS